MSYWYFVQFSYNVRRTVTITEFSWGLLMFYKLVLGRITNYWSSNSVVLYIEHCARVVVRTGTADSLQVQQPGDSVARSSGGARGFWHMILQ